MASQKNTRHVWSYQDYEDFYYYELFSGIVSVFQRDLLMAKEDIIKVVGAVKFHDNPEELVPTKEEVDRLSEELEFIYTNEETDLYDKVSLELLNLYKCNKFNDEELETIKEIVNEKGHPFENNGYGHELLKTFIVLGVLIFLLSYVVKYFEKRENL